MVRLTKAAYDALALIERSPRKSGKFWRDLGVSPQMLSRLDADFLISALYRPATGVATILRRSWSITPAGRQALEAHHEQ